MLLDADKVEEILTNLLINALNHTPAGGQVRITVVLPDPGDDTYGVTIADTGPGIAPAEQARVFERFYQSPQVSVQGGTDLGQGAAFTLRFPAPPPTLRLRLRPAQRLSRCWHRPYRWAR